MQINIEGITNHLNFTPDLYPGVNEYEIVNLQASGWTSVSELTCSRNIISCNLDSRTGLVNVARGVMKCVMLSTCEQRRSTSLLRHDSLNDTLCPDALQIGNWTELADPKLSLDTDRLMFPGESNSVPSDLDLSDLTKLNLSVVTILVSCVCHICQYLLLSTLYVCVPLSFVSFPSLLSSLLSLRQTDTHTHIHIERERKRQRDREKKRALKVRLAPQKPLTLNAVLTRDHRSARSS